MYSPIKILKAIEYLISGGFEEAAIWALDKLLIDFPDCAGAHDKRAGLAFGKGDIQKACSHYQHAVEFEPDNADYLKNLGDIQYVIHKNAQEAIALYEKALSIDPDNAGTLLTCAHLLVASHRFEEATRYYERVLSLDPRKTEAQECLQKLSGISSQSKPVPVKTEEIRASADEKIRAGNFHEAATLLERLTLTDGANALAFNDLGVIYYELGQKDKAFSSYQKATDLEPHNILYLKNLADYIWIEKRDATAAMNIYIKILRLAPQDIEALLNCAQICMVLGKEQDARDFLNCVFNVEPLNDQAQNLMKQIDSRADTKAPTFNLDDLYFLAQNKAASGDNDGAVRILTQLLQQFPKHAMAHNDIGVLFYEMGDKREALKYYEMANRLAPDNPIILKNLADYYLFEQEDAEAAMRLYVGVLEKDPEDVDCLMASGFVCNLMGRNGDAMDFYQRVTSIDPWHKEAKQAIEQLTGRDPGHGTAIQYGAAQ